MALLRFVVVFSHIISTPVEQVQSVNSFPAPNGSSCGNASVSVGSTFAYLYAQRADAQD
jgi:hypothetical protein